MLLEHPGLAKQVGLAFDQEVPRNAWQVTLGGGRLKWTEATAGGPVVVDNEPGASLPLRWWMWMLSWLPLDGLLWAA